MHCCTHPEKVNEIDSSGVVHILCEEASVELWTISIAKLT